MYTHYLYIYIYIYIFFFHTAVASWRKAPSRVSHQAIVALAMAGAVRIKVEQLHAVPLQPEMAFEIAPVPMEWLQTKVMPDVTQWKPLKSYKARYIVDVACSQQSLPCYIPITLTNDIAKRTYFLCEIMYDLEVYVFRHCNGSRSGGMMLMRQAHPYTVQVALRDELHATGAYCNKTINVTNLQGKFIFKVVLQPRGTVLTIARLREWMKRMCKFTKATPIKMIRHGCRREEALSGNTVLFKGWPKPRRVRARKRERGQTLITDFFRRISQ